MIRQITLLLNHITKQSNILNNIKEYAHQEVLSYSETIKDYEDDNKKENKHFIDELKENKEHWKDIEKLIQNKSKDELYMNWWKYGLYQ